MTTLKPEHKKAADFYLMGMTKGAALKEAGYADSVCKRPQEVFGREDVQLYILSEQDKLAERTQITKERVLQKLWEIADAKVGDFIEDDGSVNIGGFSRNERAAISSVKVTETKGKKKYSKTKRNIEIKMSDKLAALKEINNMLGYTDNSVKLSAEKELLDAMNKGFGAAPNGSESAE